MSNLKWGRAVLAIGLAAFCIMLTSCGTGKVGVSSELPDESTDVITAASDGGDNSMSDPIERLSGKFHIDGDVSARYESDESGLNVYVFYTDEGKPYMGFADSGESRISEFETGNGSYRYVRTE